MEISLFFLQILVIEIEKLPSTGRLQNVVFIIGKWIYNRTVETLKLLNVMSLHVKSELYSIVKWPY